MSRVLWLPLLLSACVTLDGQRVPVLLASTEVPCEEGFASLTLDQPEDLYLAELVDTNGDRISVSAVRSGTDVTFTCPEGVPELLVRHASVLAERADGTADPQDPAPAPAPDPGPEAPPPSGI